MLTTQDFLKGIDITALTNVTGSQLNQLVDVARTAIDKGLIISTTDSALNIPIVPNPNNNYTGITPTWWTNYIWRRLPFNNTGVVTIYFWNPYLNSDPILLNWSSLTVGLDALNARIDDLQAEIFGVNELVVVLQQYRVIDSNNIATNTASIVTLNTSVAALNSLVNGVISSVWPSGSVRWSASITIDAGWLLCDGTSYVRATYPTLFAAIGIAFGSVDINTFSVPDARGKVLMGTGQGLGLTNRTMGQVLGEETHLLIGSESGIQDHFHTLPTPLQLHNDVLQNGPDSGVKPTSPSVLQTGNSGNVSAINPHNNMQPSLGMNLLIKI